MWYKALHVKLLLLLSAYGLQALAQKPGSMVRLTVDGAINPVVAEYIKNGVQQAENQQAAALILHLNTPGGLLKSTREIVNYMLDARVPIVVYVTPSGGHAGSAGVFITMAAHVAAMAPGTNIGAAHPVNLQGAMDSIMSSKSTNDAAAFIRSIAEKRGRNATWAEEAVRSSAALAETEAVKQNVVNLIADNEADLLKQINGWEVVVQQATVKLQTANAPVQDVHMTWVQKLLNYISDPNIAYILLLLGIYGIIFEFYSPGIGFPGVVGGISLILAFYAMQTLPVNVAGLALIALAVALFVLEIYSPTHGILGLGAVVSLLLGSLMLIKPDAGFEWARLSLGVIIPAVILSALFFLAIAGIGLRAQKGKVVTGAEGIVGARGLVLTPLAPVGSIRVQGEIWQAETTGKPVEEGMQVEVVALEGLKLKVKPFLLTNT
ncbi:MAG: nodulation protein NfeD [Chitinophagaceae bacterium]|nr:nodulation protein NfeD [Chitinophagaceae bacterium]